LSMTIAYWYESDTVELFYKQLKVGVIERSSLRFLNLELGVQTGPPTPGD